MINRNSDRCTYSTEMNTFEARHQRWLHNKRIASQTMTAMVCELTIAEVHPGNLGALPPSPDVLIGKARQIGLLTEGDLRIIRGY